MSIENGKCPNCGGPLVLESTKEKAKCHYCGNEIIIQQALQRIVIDGIENFDTLLLSAQEAMDYDKDYDKARDKFNKALNLRPQDYRVLWGLYLCEIESIKWAKGYHGFVQFPNDIEKNVANAINKYGTRAYALAPEEIKSYYYSQMQSDKNSIKDNVEVEKKGCYVATAVYGSYDCPEVWVLRRYRDFSLDKHFFGKMFIKMYYKISPTIVRLFGKKKWFNNFWKKRLDKKVEKLKSKGYLDTPYDDLR